jgi:hypothetical protein
MNFIRWVDDFFHECVFEPLVDFAYQRFGINNFWLIRIVTLVVILGSICAVAFGNYDASKAVLGIVLLSALTFLNLPFLEKGYRDGWFLTYCDLLRNNAIAVCIRFFLGMIFLPLFVVYNTFFRDETIASNIIRFVSIILIWSMIYLVYTPPKQRSKS